MKPICGIGFQQLIHGLTIDGGRTTPAKDLEDYKIDGKTRIDKYFSSGHLLLKLQALVRQDIRGEIANFLNGIINDGGEEYRIDSVDWNELLKAKIKIPIHVSAKLNNVSETLNAQNEVPGEKSKNLKTFNREYEEAWLNLTPLHLAIISKSSNSIRVILEHMFLRKKYEKGEDKTDDEMMDSIIETLAEKVKMEF